LNELAFGQQTYPIFLKRITCALLWIRKTHNRTIIVRDLNYRVYVLTIFNLHRSTSSTCGATILFIQVYTVTNDCRRQPVRLIKNMDIRGDTCSDGKSVRSRARCNFGFNDSLCSLRVYNRQKDEKQLGLKWAERKGERIRNHNFPLRLHVEESFICRFSQPLPP